MKQRPTTEILNHDTDSHCIPFDAIQEVRDFLPYASPLRVMWTMLALTGCRIRELDNMRASTIYGDVIYWKLGKNQKRHRKERLPAWFLDELRIYRETHRVYQDRLFGVRSDTFRRFFNRDVRPHLTPRWRELRLVSFMGSLTEEYVYQLNGLRKSFQTLEFARQLEKWKDPTIALEFTSKKMRHSSAKITVYHYVENFDALRVERSTGLSPAEILGAAHQRRILDFA